MENGLNEGKAKIETGQARVMCGVSLFGPGLGELY